MKLCFIVKSFSISLFVLTCILVVSSATTHAQISTTGDGAVNLTLSDDHPSPGQSITISAQSYGLDINSSTVTWKVNGTTVQKGIGLTSYAATAPAAGKTQIISVSVVSTSGATVTGSVSLTTGSVDMIVENNGFVPPFFKGKVGPSYQNTVTITAIPHLYDTSGAEIDPKNIIYSWRRNSDNIADQSGYGRQSLRLVGDIVPRPFTIYVTASTKNGRSTGSAYVAIDATAPTLSFYRSDPLYGPFFNQALGTSVRIGSEKEVDVLAVPFGFNKPFSDLGNLVQSWHINGDEHPELAANPTIILRAPENSSGSSNIDLSVNNSSLILQQAEAGFSAVFNTQSSSSQ